MKTTYDKQADAFYINFESEIKKVSQTIKLEDFLFIDLGSKGEVHGIEILKASAHIPSKTIQSKTTHKNAGLTKVK